MENLAKYFEGKFITVNTKTESETEHGLGLLSITGYLNEIDDWAIYLGTRNGEVTTCIPIDTIVLLEIGVENEDLLELPAPSGANN
jgi:hypothetical protein